MVLSRCLFLSLPASPIFLSAPVWASVGCEWLRVGCAPISSRLRDGCEGCGRIKKAMVAGMVAQPPRNHGANVAQMAHMSPSSQAIRPHASSSDRYLEIRARELGAFAPQARRPRATHSAFQFAIGAHCRPSRVTLSGPAITSGLQKFGPLRRGALGRRRRRPWWLPPCWKVGEHDIGGDDGAAVSVDAYLHGAKLK
jgi:hypothetical protein